MCRSPADGTNHTHIDGTRIKAQVKSYCPKGSRTMPRNFGIHGWLQDCTMTELRRLWRFVDQAGFDWLSVWDHLDVSFFGSNSCFEALSCVALMAAETTRLRI